jgi:hypothetical protein
VTIDANHAGEGPGGGGADALRSQHSPARLARWAGDRGGDFRVAGARALGWSYKHANPETPKTKDTHDLTTCYRGRAAKNFDARYACM